MITLFASIVGFLGSIFPEIIKFLKDKQDKRHELEILDRQIQFSQIKNADKLHEIELQAGVAEQQAIYTTYTSGINWIDSINGLVRPLLAYSFFLIYVSVKFIQYRSISHKGILVEYLNILWNTDDQAIFAGIISFYFGQRTLNKIWRRRV